MGYKVYNEVPPTKVPYPFMSYEVDDSRSDGNSTEVAFVFVEGWDNYNEAGSTLRLETMMKDAVKALNKHIKQATGFSFWIVLDDRKSLKDPDATIRRRRAEFQVRILGKE